MEPPAEIILAKVGPDVGTFLLLWLFVSGGTTATLAGMHRFGGEEMVSGGVLDGAINTPFWSMFGEFEGHNRMSAAGGVLWLYTFLVIIVLIITIDSISGN